MVANIFTTSPLVTFIVLGSLDECAAGAYGIVRDSAGKLIFCSVFSHTPAPLSAVLEEEAALLERNEPIQVTVLLSESNLKPLEWHQMSFGMGQISEDEYEELLEEYDDDGYFKVLHDGLGDFDFVLGPALDAFTEELMMELVDPTFEIDPESHL